MHTYTIFNFQFHSTTHTKYTRSHQIEFHAYFRFAKTKHTPTNKQTETKNCTP